MVPRQAAVIRKLPTGVPGLDQVLGGGLPEYSFNIIAGTPGAGKTTLAHQILFANASEERPALYFSVLGEPPLKMLRYQQQFSFFDREKVDRVIRFMNLSEEALQGNLDRVLERIVREVERSNPRMVVVDSFRSVIRAAGAEQEDGTLQNFTQRLSLHLASCQATTFLVGEYLQSELRNNPVTTVADGILSLIQSDENNATVRKLQVLKVRGQAQQPGQHSVRITQDGLEVFPRVPEEMHEEPGTWPIRRHAFGVEGLDRMLGGGVPVGDVVLVAGPVGSGKTVLANHFLQEGLRQGERAVLALFEERPRERMQRSRALQFNLEEMERQGRLKLLHLRPLDLSPGELIGDIRRAVEEIDAQRLVMDSLAGVEIALAPSFRREFREYLFRLSEVLTRKRVTVLMTVEVVVTFDELRVNPEPLSFFTDDLIFLRYVELEGALRQVISVIKMRGSEHSREFHSFAVTPGGVVVGEAMKHYRGLLSGMPEVRRRSSSPRQTRQKRVEPEEPPM